MEYLKELQDNTIIICENSYKEYILKYFYEKNIFLNIKFYTKKYFFENYFFKYDEDCLCYLINKYKVKVSIAKMYLKNLYYIEMKEYKSDKLNFLVSLKQELIKNKLLIYNDNFKEFLKDYKILVIGYSYLENYELNVFEKLNANIIKEAPKYNIKVVNEFSSIYEEVNYVVKSICSLIDKGIDINKIKLCNVNDTYYNTILRLFGFYNIPIKLPSNNNLYCNQIAKKFLDNYYLGLEKDYELIKNEDSEVVNKIVKILNKYVSKKEDIIYNLIVEDFKNEVIDNEELLNKVEIINVTDIVTDEYVFLMNFTSNEIPKIVKDEEYITNNIKYEISEKETYQINKEIKEYTKNKINSMENLVITYSLKNEQGLLYPSSLIKEMNLEIKRPFGDIYTSYSVLNDKINYAMQIDNLQKYGTLKDEYFIYKANLGDIKYLTYDNKFKGINKNSLKEFLNNSLVVSYTSLSDYNKCAFKYYINHILKLNKYEETFDIFIGTLFHKVLECSYNKDFDVEKVINDYIKDKSLTLKERFFIKKLTEDIKFVYNTLKKQNEYISLNNSFVEQNIEIEIDKEIPTKIVGVVDKILYQNVLDKNIAAIIDYKTGNVDTSLNYLEDGLNLQLPIYLYLVSKSNLLENIIFAGAYIQNILNFDILKSDKCIEEEKYNTLKLHGFTNNDIDIVKYLDNEYQNSNLINGLRTKIDGTFYSSSKTLTNEKIDKIIAITDNLIDKNIDSIIAGDFNINPKKIGFDNYVGCEYCKFKDLCFKTDHDYVELDIKNNLDFLGGDDFD